MVQTIGNMTVEELQNLISRMIEERISVPQTYQIGQATPEVWQAILDSFIDQPQAPSPLEMLREERRQWRQNI